MGAIQPARFLSHTGRILPGVRRVVNVPNPAAGADWTVNVPAGVQWKVRAGQATLTTSATVADRLPLSTVTIDGAQIVRSPILVTVTASSAAIFPIMSPDGMAIISGAKSDPALIMPDDFLPQGTTFGPFTPNLQAGDQWSAIALWIEEVYVTDSQLSQIERDRETFQREETAFVESQLAQQGAGA